MERRYSAIIAACDNLPDTVSISEDIREAHAEAKQAIFKAKELTAQAEKSLVAKQFSAAVDQYEQALQSCADFELALLGKARAKQAAIKARKLKVAMRIAASSAVLIAGSIFGIPAVKRWQDARAWKTAHLAAQSVGENYERAIEFYQAYLTTRPRGLYHQEAEQQINVVLPQKIEQRDWKQLQERISNAAESHDHVIALCQQFISSHPSCKYNTAAKAVIDERMRLIAEKNWQLVQTNVNLAGDDIIKALAILDEFIRNQPVVDYKLLATRFREDFIERRYMTLIEAAKRDEADRKWDAAADAYAKAAALRPNVSEIREAHERVKNAAKREHFDKTIREAEQAETRKDWEKALAAYERALQIDPTDGAAKRAFDRAAAAARQELFESAMREGARWEAAGDWERAEAAYIKAIQANPSAREAVVARDRIISKKRAAEIENMKTHAQKALANQDWIQARELYLHLERLDSDTGRKGLAEVERLETEAKLKPLIAKAKKAEEDGNWVQARAAWQNVMQLMPSNSAAAQALANITNFEKPAGTELQVFQGHADAVLGTTFTAEGYGALSWSCDRTVRLWSMSPGQKERVLRSFPACVAAVSLRKDGHYILSGCADGTLALWALSTSHIVGSVSAHNPGGIFSVAFSPTTDSRAVSGGADGKVKLWDLHTWRAADFEDLSAGVVLGVALRGILENTLQLGSKAKQSESHCAHLGSVFSVVFSPDGHYVASSGSDNLAKIWDVNTRRKVQTLKGHEGIVWSVVYSPDGRSVLSASADKSVKVWDSATGQPVRTFAGHSGSVQSACFSPDGRYALSGSADKTIRLWDVATGRELRTFVGHESEVTSVAFSPDGRYAISASKDKTVRLWKLWDGNKTQAE